MQGKFSNKKKKKSGKGLLITLLLILAVGILAAVLLLGGSGEGGATEPGETRGTEQTQPSGSAVPTETTAPVQTEPLVQTDEPISLGDGLVIESVANYAGIYMEDGSDEVVTSVMMILLSNESEEDLQLARVDITYSDFVAEFEVTNLPAGERVVVLEKNRRSMPDEEYQSVSTRNVLFFPEPMGMAEDKVTVVGNPGCLDVTNITEEEITGEIYIYYKNSASDLLYGGITYRAVIEDPIAPGETIRILTGHYHPDTCRVVAVVISE